MTVSRRKLVLATGAGLALGTLSAADARTSRENLAAREIISRAKDGAGGPQWVRPKSYHLFGHLLDYSAGAGTPIRHEPYHLYRVHPPTKPNGHLADGKIRVSAFRDGKATIQIAFDGEKTYDRNGWTGEGADSPFWRTSMGFGMIRFALEPDYKLERRADDEVDGKPVYPVIVTDPSGEKAVFCIRQKDWRVVRIGFATPSGFHDRTFDRFYTKRGVSWVQPGRTRAKLDGVRSFDFLYTDFEIDVPMDDSLFVLRKGQFDA